MSDVHDEARTPVPPTFRTATRADASALVTLVNSAYRGDASRRGWTTEADLLGGQRVDAEVIGRKLDRPETTIVVAERAGDLVGCCELERHGDEALFGMFSVDPELQGTGVGSALLAEAERTAARSGCARMRMHVLWQRQELIAWYERRGYRRTGDTSPFPYGDERFGVPQRDDLEFVDLARPLSATSVS